MGLGGVSTSVQETWMFCPEPPAVACPPCSPLHSGSTSTLKLQTMQNVFNTLPRRPYICAKLLQSTAETSTATTQLSQQQNREDNEDDDEDDDDHEYPHFLYNSMINHPHRHTQELHRILNLPVHRSPATTKAGRSRRYV